MPGSRGEHVKPYACAFTCGIRHAFRACSGRTSHALVQLSTRPAGPTAARQGRGDPLGRRDRPAGASEGTARPGPADGATGADPGGGRRPAAPDRPLHRARALEAELGTRAHIYLKREDVLPTGSFKLNSAVVQAYYAAQEGRTTLVTETGAGQWGMSVALAASLAGLDSEIFMVRCSLDQKPYRRHYMELLGATVRASPSPDTSFGRELLARSPGHPGSLGTAISDAIGHALDLGPKAAYLSGSGVPHVYLHQTLLGLEVQAQLAALDEPIGVPGRGDHLIACSGGGSNLCGLVGPFLGSLGDGSRDLRLLAAESSAAPRLTAGRYRYGRSDLAGLTPEVLGYSMGPDFVPPPVHTAGLRNHHSSAAVSLLRHEGLLDAVAVEEKRALEAGRLVLRTEGLLFAPETTHALAAAVEVAVRADETAADPVIVVLASGSGLLDLQSYATVLSGGAR
ncbi:TrpB-like pyridoxal phosphate-dependent enzyme [Streptomyces incanus]|uniref:tryptophan synthase n=1 Tax=Streptomyces incanus TaxID=887453 RepID=A0ABW0Y3P4_9ACTN